MSSAKWPLIDLISFNSAGILPSFPSRSEARDLAAFQALGPPFYLTCYVGGGSRARLRSSDNPTTLAGSARSHLDGMQAYRGIAVSGTKGSASENRSCGEIRGVDPCQGPGALEVLVYGSMDGKSSVIIN